MSSYTRRKLRAAWHPRYEARFIIRFGSFATLLALLTVAVPLPATAQVPFTIETVDPDGNAGIGASLALDSQERPHIAYLEAVSRKIRYTVKSGATWTTQPGPLFADVRTGVTLVLDPADDPGISHIGIFCRRVGASWVEEGMGGYSPWFGTVAKDAAGDLQGVIIWSLGSGEYRGYVSHTVRNGGAWSDAVFTNGTFYPTDPHASLAIDRHGDPHISLTSTSGDSVRYWHRANGVWSQVVFTPGAWSSIALDAQDDPRISYYDSVNHDLMLAFKYDGTWVTGPLDTSFDVGLYTSQEIRDGVSYITYYAKSPGDLKYRGSIPLRGRARSFKRWTP